MCYDTAYEGLPDSAFRVPESAVGGFSEVVYLGPKERTAVVRDLACRAGGEGARLALLDGSIHSRLKNHALLRAAWDGADFAVCLDDDEYFRIPVADGRKRVSWVDCDVLGLHLRALQGCDMTTAGKTGYFSPLPGGFTELVPQAARRALATALTLGNELITPNSFEDACLEPVMAEEGWLIAPWVEVEPRRGVKFNTGGNAERRREMRQTGREHIRRSFPTEKQTSEYLSLFEKVTEGAPA